MSHRLRRAPAAYCYLRMRHDSCSVFRVSGPCSHQQHCHATEASPAVIRGTGMAYALPVLPQQRVGLSGPLDNPSSPLSTVQVCCLRPVFPSVTHRAAARAAHSDRHSHVPRPAQRQSVPKVNGAAVTGATGGVSPLLRALSD